MRNRIGPVIPRAARRALYAAYMQKHVLRGMALLFLASAPFAQAHEHDHGTGGPTEAELGSVSFETSCPKPFAGQIDRGVALIHSFWHEEALRTFKEVAAADPSCAMAWWGQAMSLFHLYSSTPSDAELAAGAEALAKADAIAGKTPREAAYIRAAHSLFDGYDRKKYYASGQRFAPLMSSIVTSYPKDLDAKAFYALGVLASTAPDDLTLANDRKAVALMSAEFRRHPDHPGLTHYLIHATDHPQLAKQGLDAARRYAAIAPAAPHALHMPAHIFARLGLWDDDIRSNLASKAAAEVTTGPRIGAENRLHAMEFLEYAYLQSGRFDEARAIVAEAPTVKRADTSYDDYYLTVEARFPMLLAIESRDWNMAAGLQPVQGAHWFSEALTLLAHSIAAGHLRDPDAGKAAVSRFDEVLAKATSTSLPAGSSGANLRDEIYAWAAFAQGDAERAIALLRTASDNQAKVGKGEVELPAREMLAEMLLLDGKAVDALKEYEASLASDPNRFNALLGAAHAAQTLGRTPVAEKYYARLNPRCFQQPYAAGSCRGPMR
jgi:tetratricopeptide (TPR) repeat protein